MEMRGFRLGRGFAALGRWDAADRMLEEFAEVLARQVRGLELVHCVEGSSFLADAALKRGSNVEATSWLERAFNWAADLNPAMKTRTLPALVCLFAVAIDHGGGDVSGARSVLAKLRRFAHVFPIGRPAASLCGAVLHARLGHPRRAKRSALRAFQKAIRLEMPTDAAEAIERFPGLADYRQEFGRLFADSDSSWDEVLRPADGDIRSVSAISRIGSGNWR
jgi:hypothetical protein